MHGELTEEFIREAPKASPHNREEQYNVIKDILTSVVIANNSAPGSLPEALDGALVTLMLKYRCDALTVYCGKTYLPVFKKGHYPGEPGNAIFLRNPRVRALFNNRGICYVNLDHIHGAEIDEYHHNMKKRGIKSSLQFIIGENNSPAALFAFDCFNDMGVYTAEETNDLLFFSHMIYAILVKFKIFC